MCHRVYVSPAIGIAAPCSVESQFTTSSKQCPWSRCPLFRTPSLLPPAIKTVDLALPIRSYTLFDLPIVSIQRRFASLAAEPGPAPRMFNEAGRDRPGWQIYGLDEKNVHLVMGLDTTGRFFHQQQDPLRHHQDSLTSCA